MKGVHIFYIFSLYFCIISGEDTTVAPTTVAGADNSTASTIASDNSTTIAPGDDSTAAADNSTTVIAADDNSTLSGNDTKAAEVSTCVHEGHDASIDPQTSDPGIFMSIEIIDETKMILHIHANEKYKGIMISTSEEGNFTIPENIPLKLMDSTTCTGVTNIDETEKDHVMVNFEKKSSDSQDPVFDIVLVRAQDTYWTGIKFPEADKEGSESHVMNGTCDHPGHDYSVPAQTSDESGVVITSESADNSTITLHIHADDHPFQGIMITTEAKGNFTVPDGNVMKIMEGDCTGVTNTDEVPKDHVQVEFTKSGNETALVEFNFLVVRDPKTYWDNIKYQA